MSEDDGAEVRRRFEIESALRGRVRRFSVPAERFGAMNWPAEHLGASAVVSPGQGARDHARAAIQLLSGDIPERRVFTHTGLRQIDGRWVYLHGGGAFGPDGPVPGVEVQLPDALARYVLPEPIDGPKLARAIRASLGMLQVAPRRLTVPTFGATYRAVLGGADFGLHAVGPTGAGKTELETLALQHYGPTMDSRHLPASWLSTGNALEGLAFVTKDALLLIDDFCPTGSSADVQRYHRDADRVFRAQGNTAGRQRMRADATLRAPKPPRGVIISTGEDTPRGQSLRARVLVLEVGREDVDWARLTACQRDAAEGLYARCLVGFVKWVVGRYDALRGELRAEVERLRQLAHCEGQHRRTPGIVADLALGLRYFLEYAHEAGAIDQREREALWEDWWAALGEAAAAQATHQRASEPARRFLQLLGAAMASGAAHVVGRDGEEPRDPDAWGWRLFTVGTGENEREEWRFQGRRVGWLDDEALYLEPDAAFAAAQKVGQDVGDALTITPQVLRKRLQEQRFLASVDGARVTLTVRRKLEGRQRSVLHVHPGALSTSTQPDKPDIAPPECGPVSGSTSLATTNTGNPTSDPTRESGDFTNESGPDVGFVGFPAGGEPRTGQGAAQGAVPTAPVSGGRENPTPDPTCDPTTPVGAQVGAGADEWQEEF